MRLATAQWAPDFGVIWPRAAEPSAAAAVSCSATRGNLGMKILAWIIGIVFVTGLLVWLGIFKAIF